jgi:hypothetical protein
VLEGEPASQAKNDAYLAKVRPLDLFSSKDHEKEPPPLLYWLPPLSIDPFPLSLFPRPLPFLSKKHQKKFPCVLSTQRLLTFLTHTHTHTSLFFSVSYAIVRPPVVGDAFPF